MSDMRRYNVEVTIDRGPSPNQINYARFIKGNANAWPLTLDAATERAEQERSKPYVSSVQVKEIVGIKASK